MNWLYRSIKALCTWCAKVCYHHQVVELSPVPKGAAILVANHVSFLDPMLVGISFEDPIIFLARRPLFRFWPFSWLLRKLEVLPVSGDQTDLASLKTACSHLVAGRKIALFPEGSRSWTGELTPLKAGMALLARKGQCPIVPILITGSFEAWPRAKRFPRPKGKTSCIIGPPIPWEEFAHLDKKTAQEAIAERVVQELKNLQESAD